MKLSHDRFDACLPVIQKWEGGWSDHPEDNGGATMRGVTQRVYEEYKGRPVTKDELRNITDAEVRDIFKAGYWDVAKCDDFRPGVDLVVFDAAVNSGPSRSVKWLQMAIGASVDGVVGPETRWKASQIDPLDVISKAIDIRMAFLRSLDDWPHFGRGWTNRVNDVRAEAVKMARGDTSPVSVPNTVQDGRLLRAYRLAKAELGTREISGAQDNPEIVQWFADVGHQWVRDDETAWCAAFAGAMLEAAGIRSTRALNARSYMEWGEPTDDPKEGDVVVFWRVSRSDWRGHVGFFVRKDRNRVWVLGGNQSNSVSEKDYPIDGTTYGVLGYRTMTAPKPIQSKEPDMALVNQPTNIPNRKVTWATVAAAISGIAAPWLIQNVAFLHTITTTEQLETAMATLIVGLATGLTGYFVRERA
jgi:uncharacterized protein (TIGR02594 family)